MTTDNRTNEPTEAQVEAAAKALRANEGFMADVHSALEVSWSEYIARLVLFAALGAAPQDNGNCGGCRDLGPHRNVPGCQYYEAPVPSSGVDEDALAEVIAKSRGFGNGWEQIPPLTREAYREVARAVADWLKKQGGESRGDR